MDAIHALKSTFVGLFLFQDTLLPSHPQRFILDFLYYVDICGFFF